METRLIGRSIMTPPTFSYKLQPDAVFSSWDKSRVTKHWAQSSAYREWAVRYIPNNIPRIELETDCATQTLPRGTLYRDTLERGRLNMYVSYAYAPIPNLACTSFVRILASNACKDTGECN